MEEEPFTAQSLSYHIGTSPFGDRVKIALNLKSVDYELLKDDLFNKSELLRQSNPVYKKFPVLIHAGNPICESLIIVEYIDGTWNEGPTIMPSDPHDCAIARFWATYIDTKWYPLLRELAVVAEGEEAQIAVRNQLIEATLVLEEAFVNCSKDKAYFGGDNIGFLDIAFGSFLVWVRVAEKRTSLKVLDEASTPRLVRWAENFCAHDAVKDVPAELEAFIEPAKKLQAVIKAYRKQ